MSEKRTLTTGEIASYCGVNFRTVIRWIERGEIKAFQLPGRGDNRVEMSEFITFLRKHEIPIPDELQRYCRRVLIVDDDQSMSHAIQRTLRSRGFETLIAHEGFQAGALLGTFVPMVMTLDLQMPGFNGFEVLKFVRGIERLNHVKILVVSALSPEKLHEALGYGANDILEKPFQNEELIRKVLLLSGEKNIPMSLEDTELGYETSKQDSIPL